MRYTFPDDHSENTSQDDHAYLPDGCVTPLALVVFLFALALFVALHLHPQGFDVIPWLLHHL